MAPKPSPFQFAGGLINTLFRRGDPVWKDPFLSNHTSPPNVTDPGHPDEIYSWGLNGVNNIENYMLANILAHSFALLVISLFIFRLQHLILAKVRQVLLLSSDSRAAYIYWATPANSIVAFTKKHLLWAPIGRLKHNREFRLSTAINFGTLPTRLQGVLLLLYLGSNFAYNTVMLDWTLPRHRLIAEFRGRSGVLAVVNMMPLFLLAGRNNPLIWLFGISFDTWNLVHRWMGRIVVLQSTCHIAAWTIVKVEASPRGWADVWLFCRDDPFVWTGLIAGICFILILFQSPSAIRHAAYETFLHLHIALAAGGLIGVFYHLKVDALPQLIYMFTCITFWTWDRFFRLARILYRNCGTGVTRFRVQALPGADGACRVDFEMVRPWSYKPGTHAYIYLPRVGLWQSHPFSIAWSSEPQPNSKSYSGSQTNVSRHQRRASNASDLSIGNINYPKEISYPNGLGPKSNFYPNGLGPQDIEKMASVAMFDVYPHNSLYPIHTPQMSLPSLVSDDNPWSERSTMSMIVSKRTGLTRSLWDMANRAPNKTIYLSGFVEGEYGGLHGLYSYGQVILVAGGVGITHCIGWARELINLWKEGRGVARKVVLIWVIPDVDQYEWCREWFDEIFAVPGWENFFTLQLYISRPRGDMLISPCSHVPAYAGRPDWNTLFERFCEAKLGTMGVTVCGPGTLSDSIRSTVRSQLNHTSIDFIEESFTW